MLRKMFDARFEEVAPASWPRRCLEEMGVSHPHAQSFASNSLDAVVVFCGIGSAICSPKKKLRVELKAEDGPEIGDG